MATNFNILSYDSESEEVGFLKQQRISRIKSMHESIHAVISSESIQCPQRIFH